MYCTLLSVTTVLHKKYGGVEKFKTMQCKMV